MIENSPREIEKRERERERHSESVCERYMRKGERQTNPIVSHA